MKAGWLKGKIHAFTRKPLEIVHLSLPPGSMVAFVHHMPHYCWLSKAGQGLGGDSLWRIERPTRMQNRKVDKWYSHPLGGTDPTQENCLRRRSVCLRRITPSTSIYKTESFDDICRRTISATGRWNRIKSPTVAQHPDQMRVANHSARSPS